LHKKRPWVAGRKAIPGASPTRGGKSRPTHLLKIKRCKGKNLPEKPSGVTIARSENEKGAADPTRTG